MAKYVNFPGSVGFSGCDTSNIGFKTQAFGYQRTPGIGSSNVPPLRLDLVPGGPKQIHGNAAYSNFLEHPVFVTVTVFAPNGNPIRVLKSFFVPANQTVIQLVSWDGKDDIGNTVADGIYTIETTDQKLRITEVDVHCSGYYTHYPKAFPLAVKQHILDRHAARVIPTNLYNIMLDVYNGTITSKGKFGDKVKNIKGHQFPFDWTETLILDVVDSVAHMKQSGDRCQKNMRGSGGFGIIGSRTINNLTVVTEVIVDDNPHLSGNINTAFPLPGNDTMIQNQAVTFYWNIANQKGPIPFP